MKRTISSPATSYRTIVNRRKEKRRLDSSGQAEARFANAQIPTRLTGFVSTAFPRGRRVSSFEGKILTTEFEHEFHAKENLRLAEHDGLLISRQ
jgi:hypothetical protein